MPSPFVIRDHTFHGQHIREYPGALANDQEDALVLAAKSYTPREVDTGSSQGDLTVIAFHANGFTKEVYEPFFEAFYRCLKSKYSMTLGSIWIADQSFQGSSAILNDQVLGNDPHWFDHSRDVIQMVNTFRKQMRRPIVALGHSMGGTQAVATAHFHPRLFETIVLLDPPMTMTYAKTIGPMLQFSLSRPETFPSKDKAAEYVRKHPFYKGWHPDVVARFIDSTFHDSPTTMHPNTSIKPKTTPASEIRGLMRPNPDHVSVATPVTDEQRYTHPDVTPISPLTGPTYNPHTRQAYGMLLTLRPPTIFILGKGSRICPPEELEHRTNVTGTQPGGSGGVATGNVKSVTISGGHFLTMTNVQESADASAEWVSQRIEKWRKVEGEFLKGWREKSLAEKQKPDSRVEDVLRNWDGKPWENPYKSDDGGRSKL